MIGWIKCTHLFGQNFSFEITQCFLWPKPQPYGFVLKLDESGTPIKTLMDPDGENLKEITSTIEKNKKIYMGSLHTDRIGVYDLEEKP